VGLDAPLQQSTSTVEQNLQLLPDVTLEWLINPSGSIRVAFFYRQNTDYLLSASATGPGKAKRYGGNLTFRRDFDKLGDIFKKRKKSKPVVVPLEETPIVKEEEVKQN
jgi:hypothetical protein